MRPNVPCVGLFDSGIGGLTVLKELRSTLPHFNYVYLGDSARFPYGSKSASTIIHYAKECTQYLISQKVEMVVVACNTASSFALDVLQEQFRLPIVGTIESAVTTALETTQHGRIGVLGTSGTIASKVYEKRLAAYNPELQIFSKACPLFVSLVEEGMLDGDIVDKVVALYLSELKARDIDTLILGCTHYPLLHDAIHKFMGDSVKLVECSTAIAKEASKTFDHAYDAAKHTVGRADFYVTDDPAHFNQLAPKFLGTQIESRLVDISQ